MTTHYLEEAEQCNRVGFMVAGELVAEGTPSGIKKAQPGHLIEFIVDQPQRASDLLKKDLAGWRVSLFGDRLHVITDEDAGVGKQRIAKKLEAEGIKVVGAKEGAVLARGRVHQRGGAGAATRQGGERED